MAKLLLLPEEQFIEEDLIAEQPSAGKLSALQSKIEASTMEPESIILREQSHGAADLLQVCLLSLWLCEPR